MIKEKLDKFMRLLLAVTIFVTSFSYVPRVFASENNNEYVKGQVIDPVNSIGSIENAGDVKLTKTVSATDTEGVYNVDITVEGKHKEETQVTTAPIYTVVVLDRSGSMRPCIKEGAFKCKEYNEEKYSSAKEGAKIFASTLLNKYSQAQLALVTFSTNAVVKRNFASTNFDNVSFPKADGGTNLAEAIKTASGLLLDKKKENSNAKLYMVILSDGYPEYYSYQPDNHSEEATNAKNNGVEIFTIGYETTTDTEQLLSSIATDEDHFVKADSSNIVDSFNNIASEIKVETPAGSDATVIDSVADGFSYVAGSANIEVGVNGKNVSFNIGDITDEGKTVSFQIEVNKDLETGLHRTNDFAKVVYTDVNGNEQTVNLEDSSKVYWEQLKYNYKVNYKEQGTNKDLISSKEVNDAIYGRTYSEVAETIKGYNLVEGTNNPSDITIRENNQELTFYYTKKNDLTYTVKYLEEGTNKELATEKTVKNQTFLDSYIEEAIDITGYNVVGDTVKTGTIDSEDLVITFYYTKKNDLTYTVKYLEEGTNKELATEKTVRNQTFLNSYREEAIEIVGYNVVGTGIDEGVINSEDLVITFYYTKKNDLTYIIDYFKDDVKVSNDTDNTYNNMTYGQIVTLDDINNKVNKYKTEGYSDGVVETSMPIEIQDGENRIVVRYSKRNDLTYTVKYLEEGTNKELATEKVVKNQTFLNNYKEEAIDITGYNVVGESVKEGTIDSENLVLTFYYTKKTDLTYTVKYLEEGTNKELATEKTVRNQTFLGEFSEEAIDITGYNVVGDTIKTGTIDSEDLVLTFYYTKKTDLTYTVKYLEEGTNKELATEKTVRNQTFLDSYKEEAIDITGYNVVGTGIDEGVINSENLVVTFYYTKKNDLTYIIDYFKDDVKVSNDTDNTYNNMTYGQIVTLDDINNKVNKYKTEGYSDGVVETSMPIEIQDGENRIVIRYSKRNDLTYTVKYLEEGTNKELATEKVVKNQTFLGEFRETALTITGYNVVGDTVKTGTIDSEDLVLTFYYTKKTDLTYTVKYLEEGTNKELATEKVVKNQTFLGEFRETALTITGYNVVGESVKEGTIDSENLVLTFYYTKKTDLTYTVKYLEEGTNKELATEKTVRNQTFLDSYKEEAIDITGYNVVGESVKEGTIDSENLVLTFYYTKKTDLTYTVKYLEEGTNKELATEKTVRNQTFLDSYKEEAIDITGYNVVGESVKEGTIDSENLVLTFYYTKKTDLTYTVKYLEEGTNKELATEKVVRNQTFLDSYKEEAIDITGYNVVGESVKEGTIDSENLVLTFYYTKKTDLTYTVKYLEEGTNKELATEKTVRNQTFLDSYKEEAIDITGYNVVGESVKEGTIDSENLVLTFYYTKKTDLTYTVKYLEEGTNKELATEKTVRNQTFLDSYKEEAIDITGYNVVGESVKEGTIDSENLVLKFYYTKKTDLTYTVKYLEEGTNKELATEKTVRNQTFLDSYKEEAIDITGYNVVGTGIDEGVINSENLVVTFYYTKKNDLTYIIDYFKDDVKVSNDTDNTYNNMTYGQIVTLDDINNKVNKYKTEGYSDGVVETSMPIEIQDVENRIVVRYNIRTDLSYSVEYYYDDVLDETKTETYNNIKYGTLVNKYEDKSRNGYEFIKDSGSIVVGEGENVIKVYYESIEVPAPQTGVENINNDLLLMITLMTLSTFVTLIITRKSVKE